MSDVRLQALYRAWRASGRVEDEVALLTERLRAGDVTSESLRAAALCGHVASAIVSNAPPAPGGVFSAWIGSLAADARIVLTACARLVRGLLDLPGPGGPLLVLRSGASKVVQAAESVAKGVAEADLSLLHQEGVLRTVYHLAWARSQQAENADVIEQVRAAGWKTLQHAAGVLLVHIESAKEPSAASELRALRAALEELERSSVGHCERSHNFLRSLALSVEHEIVTAVLAGRYGPDPAP